MQNRKNQSRLVNVLMKGGAGKRVPRNQAEDLLKSGQATRYISHTVYKALKLGIEVRNPGTRDEGGKLKARIRAAKGKATKPVEAKAESEDRQEAQTRQKKRRRTKETAK